MEKKTIGAFLAVLRKANGMTQQQVADRLNVSNKTVSKWERDETLPDITLIPALAEMFHVTSDEILRGQRLDSASAPAPKGAEKTASQARALIARTLNKHLNWTTGAAALLAAGMILLFTVSYAFFKPVLGFGIFLTLLLAGLVAGFLSLNTARTALTGGDMIEPEEALAAEAHLLRRTGNLVLAAAALLIWALPFVLVRDSFYTDSVVSWTTYLSLTPLLSAVSILLTALVDRLLTRCWPALEESRLRTRSRLIRLYACAAALFMLLIAGTAAIDSSDSIVEVMPRTEIVIHFPDRQAAEEYWAAAEDYGAEGTAWYDYCAENMEKYNLPWNASISEPDRELLIEYDFLEVSAALEDTEGNAVPIGEYYRWAFLPVSMTVDGLSASFELSVYSDVSGELRLQAVSFLCLGAVFIVSLVVIARRRISEQSAESAPAEEREEETESP